MKGTARNRATAIVNMPFPKLPIPLLPEGHKQGDSFLTSTFSTIRSPVIGWNGLMPRVTLHSRQDTTRLSILPEPPLLLGIKCSRVALSGAFESFASSTHFLLQ